MTWPVTPLEKEMVLNNIKEFPFDLIRKIRFKMKSTFQRLVFGWTELEISNLDITIARFILPRLREFRKQCGSRPFNMTKSEWFNTLDLMIYAFENILRDDEGSYTDIDWNAVDIGLALFGRYFRDLWF